MSIVIGNKTISKISIGGKTVSKIEIGGKIAYELDESPDYLCFTDVSGSANTLTLTKNNSSSGTAPTVSLEYSTDKVNWTTWKESNDAMSYVIPANGKVYLRGDNSAFGNSNCFHAFSSTGKINASGDVMTIIDKTGQTKTLGEYAFRGLFYNCTTLMTPPSISAVSVDTQGMFWMFSGCTSLETPPDMSNITSVGTQGMQSMFSGCTLLATPPDLSNTTSVGDHGMYKMFEDCTSLTTGPDLSNITSVGDYGMEYMFYECTSLATPPDLSSITTVGTEGMFKMFNGCTALTTPPDLSNITSVGTQGMYQMFYGCTALTKAYAPTIKWDTSKTENWLYNVAASGTLYANSSIISSIPTSNVSGCPSGWTKESYEPHESPDYLCFTDVSGSENTLTLEKNNSTSGTAPTVNLEYSTDKVNWTTWEESNDARSYVIPANGKVYLRGDNTAFANSSGSYHAFSSTGKMNASGDVMTIIDKTGQTKTLGEYAFRQLFYNCTTLMTPPDLSNITTVGDYSMRSMFSVCTLLATPPVLSNITEVGEYGMQLMFRGCTSLKTPPDLSNITTVGTYGMWRMFYNCTALKTPPDLSNITSVGTQGMYQMFYGCTSLETRPDLSSITTVDTQGMQYMFQDCTSLVTPPVLSNITTVGKSGMSYMFYNCTALTTPPDLSNITTVGNYGMSRMFYGCTSLETGPDLSNITSVSSSGMLNMFNGCTSLTKAYAPTIKWDTSKTENWLNGVAASGTLYAKSSIISSIPTKSVNGCPSGWTKQSL